MSQLISAGACLLPSGEVLVWRFAVHSDNWKKARRDGNRRLPAAASDAEVGAAVREALSSFRSAVEANDEMPKRDVLRFAGFTSWQLYYRATRMIDVVELPEESLLRLTPGRSYDDCARWLPEIAMDVPLCANNETVGAAIRMAFSRCILSFSGPKA